MLVQEIQQSDRARWKAMNKYKKKLLVYFALRLKNKSNKDQH